ncbi:hypothetical protein QQ045_027750 [Rhodiola kirilowii]
MEASAVFQSVQWNLQPENKFVVGYVKINVDGAWDRVTRKAGVGLCCRDDTGVMLFVESSSTSYLSSSFEAELWGLHRGLELAEGKRLKRVVFEFDSADVFNVLLRKSCCAGRFAGWVTSCRHLLGRNSCWLLSLVPREANSWADMLARKAKEEE